MDIEYQSFKSSCQQNSNNQNCGNSGFNFGSSSRLGYDTNNIDERIQQSTAPLQSILDPVRVRNCNECHSLNGPRSGKNGYGVSIPIQNPSITPAQDLVDIDSVMTNRNVKTTKTRRGMVNDVDLNKYKLHDAKLCDRGLDPLSSILSYPKQLYREMSINRFYDNNINPQLNIYWNGAVNSRLEAKDNYNYDLPYSLEQDECASKVQPNRNSSC
jgi:hypothetical protein